MNEMKLGRINQELQDKYNTWKVRLGERLSDIADFFECTSNESFAIQELNGALSRSLKGLGIPINLNSIEIKIKRYKESRCYNWKLKLSPKMQEDEIRRESDPLQITYVVKPDPFKNPVNETYIFVPEASEYFERQPREMFLMEIDENTIKFRMGGLE